jgi:hypothetical protein
MIDVLAGIIKNLSNRETAIAIWILIGLIWAFTQSKIRQSLLLVIKSFFAWKLSLSYLAMLSYIAIVLFILHGVGIWNRTHITTIILWIICVGFVMLFENSKANDESFFKNSVKANLKVLVVFEFLINFYVFSIWVELLLVPISGIIGGLLGIAAVKKEYASLQKSLNNLITFIGTLLVGYALYMAISDYKNLFTLNNFESFMLPILLTIMFLPFVYLWALYANYETLFTRYQFFANHKSFLPYLKKKTFLAFRLNLWLLTKWAKHINTLRFEDRASVDHSISAFKQMQSKTELKTVQQFNQGDGE